MVSVSWRRLFYFTALILIVSLTFVGCERPLSDNDSEVPDTTESVDTGNVDQTETDVSSPTDTEDTPSSDEALTEATSPEAEGETTGEGDTPRPEDTGDTTPTEGEEASADEATDASDETPADDGGESEASTESESPAEEGTSSEVAEGGDQTDDTATDSTADTTQDDGTSEAGSSDNSVADSANNTRMHTVVAGDNLYRIGLQYNVSWVRLAEANDLDNPNQLTLGQVLTIPGNDEASEGDTDADPTPSPLTETTYVVKAGDNLYRIGLGYEISWVQIAEANGIVNPNQIMIGQVIKIPVDTPGPTPQFTHQVKANETLFRISLQYGVSWMAVAEANDIRSPYVIYVGQSLIIPGG